MHGHSLTTPKPPTHRMYSAEPLINTDGEREEEESDVGEEGRRYRHHHLPSLEIGGASYDDDRSGAAAAARMAMMHHGGKLPSRSPSHNALLDFNEQFRSLMSDDWVQPRKARWNRKVRWSFVSGRRGRGAMC